MLLWKLIRSAILLLFIVNGLAFAGQQVPADTLFNSAKSAFETRDYPTAVNTLSLALAENDSLAHAWELRGECFRLLNQAEQAWQDFDRALQLDSTLAFSWLGRGRCTEDYNRKHEAIQDFSVALSLNPLLQEAYYERAKAHFVLGANREVLADVSQFLSTAPNHSEALLLKGKAEYKLKFYENALQSLEQAIQFDAALADAVFMKGLTLGMAGREEEGIAWIRKAAKMGFVPAVQKLERMESGFYEKR